MQPVVELPKLKVAPPNSIMSLCKPLHEYENNDVRDQIKTTIKNHNLYFLCASKMKSATLFLKSQ